MVDSSTNILPRNIFLYLATFSISLCCISVYPGQCQEITGYLSGKVVSGRTGDPIASATVLLIDEGGNPTDFGAYTNTSGFYFVTGIPKGQYTIKSSMMGYETYLSDTISIIPGDPLGVDISMKAVVLEGPQYHKWPYPWSDRNPPPDSTKARLHVLNVFRTVLEGRVTEFKSEFGQPIIPVPKASLSAIDSSGLSVMTVSSDLDGYFTFRSLPPGMYQLLANAEGFLSALNKAIPVESGWRVNVPVSMRRRY